MRGKVVVTQVV